MIGEISIAGVFIPSLLIWGLVAFALNLVLRRVLAMTGFYRLVWHRALFDAALYAIVLACVASVAAGLLEP
jgi:Protein of unknown function (DUF1656)